MPGGGGSPLNRRALSWVFGFVSLLFLEARSFEEITFEAEDDLTITADLYRSDPRLETPFIVLFHQAGFSRGAYREIAPRLNALGFNAMAQDHCYRHLRVIWGSTGCNEQDTRYIR